MTYRLLHISTGFQGVPKMRDLEPYVGIVGDWIRYSPTNWLVWSDRLPIDIVNTMTPALDQMDTIFVGFIDDGQFTARLPPWVWYWIHAKRPDIPIPGLAIQPPPPFPPLGKP